MDAKYSIEGTDELTIVRYRPPGVDAGSAEGEYASLRSQEMFRAASFNSPIIGMTGESSLGTTTPIVAITI